MKKVDTTGEDVVNRNEDYRWEVTYGVSGGVVRLGVVRGMTTLTNTDLFVNPPNWFERLMRLTHKSKIEKAILKQDKRCKELNECDAKDRKLKTNVKKILAGCEVK